MQAENVHRRISDHPPGIGVSYISRSLRCAGESRTLAGFGLSGPGVRGFTLIELIVATAILVILTGLAVPIARVAIKREKERQLRHDLWELRDAIDRYKDTAGGPTHRGFWRVAHPFWSSRTGRVAYPFALVAKGWVT